MSEKKKVAGPLTARLKKYNGLLLRISAVMFALCYAMSYMAGMSDNPVFMGVSFGILVLANLVAAVLK